ncbi:hypothetical protein OP862_15910 [Yersinia massiliensis]|jgi:DNA-binding winged helix-turn-helix (wHTH) protein|uniref:OmpR/PhoB-type domain-containing protein n=1 Tax=Yersinia massiliensis TaxID=419257 RepID=A0AA90Y0T8_9GAMM|nr:MULTISPECIES: hypothetical protein [Yersinia]MDA5547612.1 hypothetical protein [Yersinia massiliensis]NIL25579.1 hypothetical protein [Yersinia massiliensis]OWF72897.1 hypothetical protein B4902_11705 [Yersinia frederiksenii]PHZ24509.1 hypothetical protein CS535_06360 [Yersinia massiliensis]UZM78017.1 hypothetical protein OP862_15910 [Yersinia massiliensis]
MSHKIVFNNKVVYDHTMATLYNISNENEKVLLTTPANHCLHIITNNRPEITSQRVLFADVWESHGAPINSNTFYQNISIIRRAFKQLGLIDDVIVTVPRRGVRIASSIDISVLSPVVEGLTDSMEVINEDGTELDGKRHAAPAQDIILGDLQREVPLASSLQDKGPIGVLGSQNYPVSSVAKFFSSAKKINFNFMILLSFFATVALSAQIFDSYFYSKSRFYDYQSAFYLDKCDVFSQVTNDAELRGGVEDMVKVNAISCHEPKRIYYSTFPGLPRVSLIVCDGDIIRPGTYCSSYYQSILS